MRSEFNLFKRGLLDSLEVMTTYQRYCSGRSQLSSKMKTLIQSSLFSSLTCIVIMLFIDALSWGLSWLLPTWIFFPLKVLTYIQNMIKQTVYVSQIATCAVKIELEVLDNAYYIIYQLENSDKDLSVYEQVNLVVKALLFSVILLIQTTLLDVVLLLLPDLVIVKLIVTVIAQLLYSVYISVGLYSLKIPYQDHLPYYFDKNIGYLAGLSLIASVVLLNFTAFPYLGAGLSLVLPFLQLQAMHRDPPSVLGEVEGQSYKQHLTLYHRDAAYKQRSQNMGGWFKVPKMLRPYFVRLVKPFVQLLKLIISPFI